MLENLTSDAPKLTNDQRILLWRIAMGAVLHPLSIDEQGLLEPLEDVNFVWSTLAGRIILTDYGRSLL